MESAIKDINSQEIAGKYYKEIDCIKLFLAILVLIRHTCQYFVNENDFFFFLFADTLSTIAVPFFFIASGFLLFKGNCPIKKQILRIIRLYAVYSVLYAPFRIVDLLSDGFYSWHLIIRLFLLTILSSSYYHLWFLPALAGGLFLSVYVSKTKLSKLPVIYQCGMAVGLMICGYVIKKALVVQLNDECKMIFETFLSTCFSSFFLALPLVWLGRCSRFINISHTTIKRMAVIALIFMFVESALMRSSYQINGNLLSSNILALLLINYTKDVSWDLRISTVKLRNMSTLIYCIHPVIIKTISFINKKIDFGCIALFMLPLGISFIACVIILLLKQKFEIIKYLY